MPQLSVEQSFQQPAVSSESNSLPRGRYTQRYLDFIDHYWDLHAP